MKRIITILIFVCVSAFAFAQSSSILRPRIEIAEVSTEDINTVNLEVFYMNDENPRTYYLSLGHLGIGSDIIQIGFDPVFELFVPLGNTIDEAIAKMTEIKEFYKLPRLEQREINACFAALYPNDKLVPVIVTSRRLLSSKILEFSIPTQTEGLVRATHISKSDFGSLLMGMKIYKKLHPKQE